MEPEKRASRVFLPTQSQHYLDWSAQRFFYRTLEHLSCKCVPSLWSHDRWSSLLYEMPSNPKGKTLSKRYTVIALRIWRYLQQGLEIHGLEEHEPWRYTVFNWFPKHLRYTVFDQKPWRCTVFSFDVQLGCLLVHGAYEVTSMK